MAGDPSFVQLINSLSGHYAEGRQVEGSSKTTWHQFLLQDNAVTVSRKLKRCKQICLDGLLKAPNNQDEWDAPGKDLIQGEGLRFALEGDQETCDELQELVDKLPDQDPAIDSVLRFLLALKNTGGIRGSKSGTGFQEIGDCIDSFKRVRLDSKYSGGVKAYNTKFNFKANFLQEDVKNKPSLYRMYSKKDFEASPVSADGKGILVHKSPTGKRVPPVFSPDKNALEQAEQSEQNDEGYSSPVPTSQNASKDPSSDIWDQVLSASLQAPQVLTWENIGSGLTVGKQRPFASEAQGEAVHNLWKKCMLNLNVVYPEMKIPELAVIPEATLCTHICYLLTGIQSQSFLYNKSTNKFEMRTGLCIEGLSPDSLASLCQKYLDTGAVYRHLYVFVNLQKERPWSRTVIGFCAGILRYLNVHSSSCIYIASRVKTLGKLVESVRPLVDQIDMIGSICKLHNNPSGWEELPSGIELLSLLLQVSVRVCQEKETLILISLFKSAVEPYFRFLKRWLFSGECEHSYKEFGLKMDTRYVNSRNVDYWNLTHCLAQINNFGEATAFLADIQEKVFRTGKSLALLKIIAPNHHLCGRFREIQPNFVLAVTNDEQTNLRSGVDRYLRSVEDLKEVQAMTWQQKREHKKLQEAEQAKIVQKRHDEELDRLKEERDEKEREKKRKQKERHNELLLQMEQSKVKQEEERRKRRREEELIEEEAERMAAEARQREAEEAERIRQFYSRLEREAEDRERRADWRLRRNNPSFKYRRMLLHRELHDDQITKLSKLKYPLTKPMDVTAKIEKATILDGITSTSLEPDSQGNYILVCLDNEGNRLEVGLDLLMREEAPSDSSDLIDIIKNRPFTQLPNHVRLRIQNALIENRQNAPTLDEENNVTTALDQVKQTPESQAMSPLPLGPYGHLKSTIGEYLYQDAESAGWYDQNGNNSRDSVDMGRMLQSPTSAGQSPKARKNSLPIERVLYPQRYFSGHTEKVEFKPTEINLKVTGKPLPYTKSFPQLKLPSKQESEVSLPILASTTFPPLSLMLQNSILIPLRAQQKLVDAALLSQLLIDYKLEDHFVALRRYLFMADGEFGRQLVISMCMLGKDMNPADQVAGELHQHLVGGAPAPSLLCPGSLNRVLETAVCASQEGSQDPLAANLTFTLKENAENSLSIPGLSLGYRVAWPCNIILSKEALGKYSSVLEFMVSLRTCLVSLEMDWTNHTLNRRQKKDTNYHQHRLHIIRHEMLNFIRNLHSYVTAQVLEVSWMEFQDYLNKKVTNLDELMFYHNKYLNRVLFRCLLNQKATPVMKIIKSIFLAINKFTSLIRHWKGVGDITTTSVGDIDTVLWEDIVKQYRTFQKTSKFLFGLVTKLSSRGYQPHFQDLLTRLNFNGFYETNSDTSISSSILSTQSTSSAN